MMIVKRRYRDLVKMRKLLFLISTATLIAACGGKTETAQTSEAKPAETSTVSATASTSTPAPTASTAATPATANVDKAALVEQAKGAMQKLGGTLKAELEAAITAGGPVEALGVCQKRAPEIAQAVSAETGMQVKRISLKNRNPIEGAANEWQTKVLNDFEAGKAAGTDPNNLMYSEVVGNEFRLMKVIPTGGLCLTCHGTEVKPEIMTKLKELYPNDLATGFKEGDLRGAFVVIKQLAQ